MRAVLVAPTNSLDGGGIERFCAYLQGILDSAGWETAVALPDRPVPTQLRRFGLGPTLDALAATRRARTYRPDLVISNGFLGGPVGRRRIHVYHGTMVGNVSAGGRGSRRYRIKQAIDSGVPEALLGLGATVVAVSRATAREVRRRYGHRVHAVIPNAVDTRVFRPGDRAAARRELGLFQDRRYALFAGRFEYRKGADVVPDACARAGYDLVVAGPIAPAGAVAPGVLSPARLAMAYRAADCVVFPTRYEGCSLVALEALASGVPLITTDTGGMSDFLLDCPDYRRFIVAPTVDSVAEGLARVQSRDHGALLADAVDVVTRTNDLETLRPRWLELIGQVMDGLG